MRILVFADSHRDTEHMKTIIADEKPDALVHLGDHINDALALQQNFPALTFYCVAGNCDYSGSHSLEQLITLEGKRIFLTHGHRYRVKEGHAIIRDKGLALGADLTLFGHTHKSMIDYAGGMCMMNPGHIGRTAYSVTPVSYGLVTIKDGDIRCDIIVANAP